MKQFLKKVLGGLTVAAALASTAQSAIVEVSGNITADTRWTRDNVYMLTSVVYVLPPAKLTVEPGTLIRGAIDGFTTGTNNPGTVCICRGAKIIGNATADDPIIFTSMDDTLVPGGVNTRPVTVNGTAITPLSYSVDGLQGNNAFSQSSKCGGVYLLGRSVVAYDGDNRNPDPQGINHSGLLAWADGSPDVFSGDTLELPSGSASPNIVVGTTLESGDGVGFAQIEGLAFTPVTLGAAFDPDGPPPAVTGAGSIAASTSFNASVFGGVDPDDDSGVIRFWSIRYGGFTISTGIEVNGLTLGGVGRGTVVEFIEVAQNSDDSIEIFGGTVNAKYLFHILSSDDGFDGDMGYQGNLQHLFGICDNESYPRVGYANPADAPTLGRTSVGAERMIEWDGPEGDNSGGTPDTDALLVNVTLIGNRGNPLAVTDPGITGRRGASSLFTRMVVEDVSGTMWSPSNGTTAPYPTTTDWRDSLYFNVATVGATSGTSTGHAGLISATPGAAIEASVTLASASQIRAKGHATKNGLDPRLVVNTAGVDARDLTLPSIPSRTGVTDFFSPTLWKGAMRDNNWLFGWSWTHRVDLMPTTNASRPAVVLGFSGSNPTVTFTADAAGGVAGDSIIYMVERSTNGTDWVTFGYVFDGSTLDAPTQRLADSNAGALAITVTDTATTFTGSPIHYRVIPQ